MAENEKHKNQNDNLLKVILQLLGLVVFMLFELILIILFVAFQPNIESWFTKSADEIAKEKAKKESFVQWEAENKSKKEMNTFWSAADINAESDAAKKKQLEYGQDLIAHTAKYLGPKGSVMQITNGMNCQNCHLDAGTKVWGNNYGSVFSTYPKYRPRSGKEEDIYKRINDCFERSLNGKALALNSKEMQAIKAYIEYVGKDVKKQRGKVLLI